MPASPAHRTIQDYGVTLLLLIKALAVLAETAAAGDCIMYIRIRVKAADNAFCCILYNRLWQITLRRAKFPKSNVPNTTEHHIRLDMPHSSVQSAIEQLHSDTNTLN